MRNPTRPIVIIEIGSASVLTIGPINPLTIPKMIARTPSPIVRRRR